MRRVGVRGGDLATVRSAQPLPRALSSTIFTASVLVVPVGGSAKCFHVFLLFSTCQDPRKGYRVFQSNRNPPPAPSPDPIHLIVQEFDHLALNSFTV